MQVVLKVQHGISAKMVAKVFEPQSGVRIAMHEGAANQRHQNLDCPGGVDLCVIEWLRANNVREWHHWDKDNRVLYVADVEDILKHGIFQSSGGRTRQYLPQSYWREYGQIGYRVPWITDEVVLQPSASTAADNDSKP